VVEVLPGQDGPERPSALHPVDRTDATTLGAHAELWRLGHLDLGDQPAGCRIPSGELDAGRLSDQTAPAVAPDEVVRRYDWPSDSATSTPVSPCANPVTSRLRWIGTASSPTQPGQDALDVVLPQREPVVVPGGGSR
jgi:hypothetical protein